MRVRASAMVLAVALAAAALATEKAQYGTWGFDATGADSQTRPGDDFFRYANGAWLDRTAIPADKPGYSLFLAMTDTIDARLHELMEQAAAKKESSDLEGKVGAFYASFMDERRIESLGARGIAPELDSVRTARSRNELAGLMDRAVDDFDNSLFDLWTDVDLKDPKRYAVYLSQSGLGLPDRDYYLEPQFAVAKSACLSYVAKTLHLIGWPDADARVKDVVDFETRIAAVSWTKAQDRDVEATYNPVPVAELKKLAPGFDWSVFLREAGLGGVTRVIVAEKSAFPKLASVYSAAPLDTLRAWQAFHIGDRAAPYLSQAFDAA